MSKVEELKDEVVKYMEGGSVEVGYDEQQKAHVARWKADKEARSMTGMGEGEERALANLLSAARVHKAAHG